MPSLGRREPQNSWFRAYAFFYTLDLSFTSRRVRKVGCTQSGEIMSDQRIAEHRTFKDYGPGNLEILDDDEEEGAPHYTFRTLVKPFVIKQWVYKGKMYVGSRWTIDTERRS
ncbi:hypothetical protein FRC20_009903 [Serendipita sp. 405]|nr:hypothetical protein FRC20_009903 [Serendipita sp. 405]